MKKLFNELRMLLLSELLLLAIKLVPKGHPEEREWMIWFSIVPMPRKGIIHTQG